MLEEGLQRGGGGAEGRRAVEGDQGPVLAEPGEQALGVGDGGHGVGAFFGAPMEDEADGGGAVGVGGGEVVGGLEAGGVPLELFADGGADGEDEAAEGLELGFEGVVELEEEGVDLGVGAGGG